LSYNRSETFNVDLFRRLGSSAGDGGLGGGLGVLGLTVPEEYGGTGMADATSVCIVHEELSYSDPALCLSYLAHSILFANNLAVNGSPEQVSEWRKEDGASAGPQAGWTGAMEMRGRRCCISHPIFLPVIVLTHTSAVRPFSLYLSLSPRPLPPHHPPTHSPTSPGKKNKKLATFLPPVCDGTKIGGMCMSEPNAGTDVLGMRTRAVPTSVSGVDGYVINGTKMWITNGTISGDGTGDVYLVYARTGDGRSDITQFVVEGGMPGFRLGSKIGDKLGMRASPTAELVFEDVFVPSRTHVVGDANGAASCMMRNLEIERVALAAMAVGIARRALDEMASYASSRSAFGRPNLFGFGQIQRHVSESYAEYRAGKSYLYAVANGLDLHGGGGNGLDADGVKLYCATMAKNVSDRAIQVLGGNGYVGEYVVERMWRDSKLLEIGGGTNESHHKNMSRDLLRMGGNKLE
jgi:isovaleryl-CoA dehydrogenase